MRDPGRRHTLLLAGSWLLLLGGCASDGIETSVTFDPLASFPRQASYVWDEGASRLPRDERIRQMDLDPLIRQVADEQLAARGYRRADGRDSDYRLSYQLVVHTWTGPDNSRSVASLSLMLVENASGRRVWVGFGQAEVHVGLLREERRERLRKAMAAMLADFPPSQRGDR